MLFRSSYASGVATAVSEYIRNTPEFDHAVIARARRGFDVSSAGLDDRTHLLSANTSIWRLITASRKKIVEFSPDVIHCHSSEAGVYGRLLAARYRTPAIYSPHAFAFIREDVPKWRRRIFRSVERLLSSTTAAFVTAGSAETALVRQLTARKPTYEAHPYVTILDRQSSHQKKDIDIVTTGRVAPQKDPDFFAQVILELRQRGGDCRVVWVGDGDPVRRAELEDAGIEITGWCSPGETLQHLENSKIYVHTAAWEAGIAYSIIEAAALGLPVVARERPEINDRPGVMRFSTPVEGASMLLDLLHNPSKYDAASSMAEQVADGVWRSRQRESLLRAYAESSSHSVKFE